MRTLQKLIFYLQKLRLLLQRKYLKLSKGWILNLDSPMPCQECAQRIEVKGWAYIANAKITIDIFANGTKIDSLKLTEERQDVIQVHSLAFSIKDIGFREFYTWDELFKEKSTGSIKAIIIAKGGEFALGPVRVYKSRSQLTANKRSNYKGVWTSEGRTKTTAMLSVASMADNEEFKKSGQSSADTIANALGISSTDVVLEIGCGIGRIGLPMSPRCSQWIGTDVSPTMLSNAKEFLSGLENVALKEISGFDLCPIDSSSIDKIYCSTVFMHLEEWDRYSYIQEAFRVLKPGGRCYFDNINLTGDEGWEIFVEMSKTDPANRPPNISKASTPEELKTYLKRAGFCEIQIKAEIHYVSAIGQKPH